VPVYWPLGDAFIAVKFDPARYTSHVLTPGSLGRLAGFHLLTRVGDVAIWRRTVDPPSTIPPINYSRRIRLQPIPDPPTVNPRW
jgi:hypothetical protein